MTLYTECTEDLDMFKKRQNGMTFIGILIVVAVIAFFVVVAIRLLPMYQEYYSVVSILETMKPEMRDDDLTKAEAKRLLNARFNTGYVFSVKPEHIKLLRNRGNTAVKKIVIDYEVREPFIGNIDIVGTFHAEAAVNEQ